MAGEREKRNDRKTGRDKAKKGDGGNMKGEGEERVGQKTEHRSLVMEEEI